MCCSYLHQLQNRKDSISVAKELSEINIETLVIYRIVMKMYLFQCHIMMIHIGNLHFSVYLRNVDIGVKRVVNNHYRPIEEETF